MEWSNIQNIPTKDYVCGYCGTPLASEKGWRATGGSPSERSHVGSIYICHKCHQPTYFKGGNQYPGHAFGGNVEDVTDQSVLRMYEEARQCTAASAYTAAVLCCRKLLMNIAVSKGAAEGKRFIEYIDYLASQGYLPPDGKNWVDHIRKKGNEATHEIAIMSREDAEELISFSEMLLKFIFEYPAKMQRKIAAKP